VLGGLAREAQDHQAFRCKSAPHTGLPLAGFPLQSLADASTRVLRTSWSVCYMDSLFLIPNVGVYYYPNN
jgi:hypothetical protein